MIMKICLLVGSLPTVDLGKVENSTVVTGVPNTQDRINIGSLMAFIFLVCILIYLIYYCSRGIEKPHNEPTCCRHLRRISTPRNRVTTRTPGEPTTYELLQMAVSPDAVFSGTITSTSEIEKAAKMAGIKVDVNN